MPGGTCADHGAGWAGETREDNFEFRRASGMLFVGRHMRRGSSGMGSACLWARNLPCGEGLGASVRGNGG